MIHSPYFEVNPSLLTWISSNIRLNDYTKEDPVAFLRQFKHICSAFTYVGVSTEVVKLLLIPFALGEKVKAWLDALPPDTVTT